MDLQHWESYYRSGRLVSCPVGPEPRYTGEVRDAWVEFFSSLADGARVLDIATGNGAVALLAKDTAAALGRSFEIHGVDLARIDPPRHVPNGQTLLAGILFHPGVPAESLPFEADSVDAVCGQYALEYTDVPRALAEAFRILRPAGRCQFILHHSDSVIVRNAHGSLTDAGYVLDESKVLRKFRRFCELERETPSKVQTAWRDLAALAAELKLKTEASPGSLVLAYCNDALRGMFEQRRLLSYGQLLTALDGAEREMRAQVRRLQDLVGAAQTGQDIEAVGQAARTAGFCGAVHGPQLHGGDHLVGWRLNFAKP